MSATPTPQPQFPKFISVEDIDCSATSEPNSTRFRLISYNILAQAYVKSSIFPHSPAPCLKWKARSQTVLTVLKNLGADFLCLQEVDEYESFYKGNMESNGYSSIYIQRTGKKRDGCGIFFKRDRAELVLQEQIDYNDLLNSIPEETIPSDDKQNDVQAHKKKDAKLKSGSTSNGTPEDRGDINDPQVRLKRDCVGIMAAFKIKDSHNHIVIVANTHIYWDPELADVKLAQAKYLLSRVTQFRQLVSDRFKCAPSVFVAGDFNSTPGDKVYEYLNSCNSSDSQRTKQEDFEDAPIPLCSVYGFTRGEPKFTNCTPSFTDTLDYIFFSPSKFIKPVSLLELLGSDSPDVAGGLPNWSHPSDHLPIGAEFHIENRSA
ncbi:hypothetical protein UlMin_028654 [Ulmus minor]